MNRNPAFWLAITYVECGATVNSILKVLPEPHTVEAKRLHTFVLYSTGEVGRRGNSKAMLTYSQFSGRINGVLENILLSIPKTFTSAQFMAAVKTFLPDECAQILSRTTIRGLHVWMARWYLNGNQTITKAGVKTIEAVNGNKSTNALWNNPLK